jgi:hypothetical protein
VEVAGSREVQREDNVDSAVEASGMGTPTSSSHGRGLEA